MKSVTRHFVTGAIIAIASTIAVSGIAEDKIKFTEVGEYQAKGSAKEVKATMTVRYVKIESIQGRTIINTVVIREGGKKTPVKVLASIQQGKSHTIDFGKEYSLTGLRISDDAGGTYKVYFGK